MSILGSFATNSATPVCRICGSQKRSAASTQFPFWPPANSTSKNVRTAHSRHKQFHDRENFPFHCQSHGRAVHEAAIRLFVAHLRGRLRAHESRRRISARLESHQSFRSAYHFVGVAAENRL